MTHIDQTPGHHLKTLLLGLLAAALIAGCAAAALWMTGVVAGAAADPNVLVSWDHFIRAIRRSAACGIAQTIHEGIRRLGLLSAGLALMAMSAGGLLSLGMWVRSLPFFREDHQA